jgi:predicted transcriptional regulator of viral defense system
MRQPTDTAIATAEGIFRAHDGVMRTGEALDAGIHRRTLYWMRDNGLLEPLSRGVYVLASFPLPASPDIAAVLRRVPKAVLCLVSALAYHEIGTQIPNAVQIALPRSTRPPRFDYPRVQVFSMGEEAFKVGIESHATAGSTIRVYSLAKTVADCFKFRNRIGHDVAIEALQEAVRSRHVSPAEILEYAKIDRVARVIRPYLEALQ